MQSSKELFERGLEEFELESQLAQLREYLIKEFEAHTKLQSLIAAQVKTFRFNSNCSALTERVKNSLTNTFHVGCNAAEQALRRFLIVVGELIADITHQENEWI